MEFHLPLKLERSNPLIKHEDKILLIGSCFTEHISSRLADSGMQTLANPNGILFNPISVAHSIRSYISNKHYTESDLFYMNEIWNCWDFHSRFSKFTKTEALEEMNHSIQNASLFIKKVDWIIITLGSAYQYFLIEEAYPVANCHRAPASIFRKELLPIDVIEMELGKVLDFIHDTNPHAHIIFTISPVRHIREGVVNNNRSKARLIESIHSLIDQYSFCHYFPAYEIAIDVLRDYRFYDIDMVHPNYAATQYIWQQFCSVYFTEETKLLIDKIQDIRRAYQHKVRFDQTETYKNFRLKYKKMIEELTNNYPYLGLTKELIHFS